jgi:hypothetical protein
MLVRYFHIPLKMLLIHKFLFAGHPVQYLRPINAVIRPYKRACLGSTKNGEAAKNKGGRLRSSPKHFENNNFARFYSKTIHFGLKAAKKPVK